MKNLLVVIFCVLFLAGCNGGSAFPNTNHQTVIDWVDFIHVNDKMYDGLYSVVIADQSHIGEEIGEVKFKVSENVFDSSYQTKNGDAAFWEKGTKLYAVKGKPSFIAVKDPDGINGYRLYESDEEDGKSWHYKDMEQKSITKIEIYEGYSSHNLQNIVTDKGEIVEFFALLDGGETKTEFNPNTSNGDPIAYTMVFYSKEPLAYEFTLFYDSEVWYWHPWDTSIISSEIAEYVMK